MKTVRATQSFSRTFLVPLFSAALLAVATEVAHSQPQDPCATSAVSLSTGYDHQSGGVLPVGNIDPRWIVVADPFASTSEPRPATVIQKNTAWQNPQAQTQWISGYPTAVQTQNGAYIFETVFCLEPGIDLNSPASLLVIGMRADDACTAYLNGAVTPFHTGQAFNAATVTTSTYVLGSIGAVVGQNTLRIQVDNISSVAMGLNAFVQVLASPNNTAEKPSCCSPYGAIQGYKFNDLNGNGIQDSGEPLLPNWQINLVGSNGVSLSALTDSTGFYNFVDLPAGSYTVTETMQSGWVQTYPASGQHVVNITGIQGFAGLAFGNQLDPCATTQVVLNTGYDHSSAGTLAIGSIDPRWTVVADPTPSTSEPRPATVILKNAAWHNAEPLSQWISGYPTSTQTVNGAYIFETHFCLAPGFAVANATITIGMRADDACSAYLNGGSVAFHTGQAFGASTLTVSTYTLASIGAVVGTNTLRIQVDNISSVAMGLDLVASVDAPSGTAERPECCSNVGSLQGLKFNDVNGNGVRDAGEGPLAGWQINLIGSNGLVLTVVTDSEGFFNFLDLDPATYTLTETMQPGWAQTYPASGSHVVTLTGIQGVNGLDFGNHHSGGPLPYCTAGTSTNGCLPSINATLEPSATFTSGCVITVSNVEGQKFGILFYGINNMGFSAVPWAAGSTSYLCVKAPTQRTVAQNSGGTLNNCNGTLALDWNAYITANPTAFGSPFSPGDKLYFQAWYRDPPAVKTTNLSNALELTMQP